MAKFKKGGTVICSIELKDEGTLTDPATSTKIVITDPVGIEVVTSTGMSNDGTGLWHYDYTPATTVLTGKYIIVYTATDGSRITKGATGLDGCTGIFEFDLE